MLRAAHEALGNAADVRVVERASAGATPPLHDHQAEVSVEWDEIDANALLHWRDEERSVVRRVTFTSADAPAERGRTLGFVLASMLPERAPGEVVQPPPPPPPPPSPLPPRGAGQAGSTGGAEEPGSSGGSEAESNARRAIPEEWTGAIEAVGTLAFGVGAGEPQAAFGGGAAGLWFPSPRWALRVGLDARTGRIVDAQTDTFWTSLSVGVGWSFVQARGAVGVDLGLRVDAGIARQALTHFSSDDLTPVEQVVWMPVADSMLEVRFRLTPGLAIVAVGGAELAFTATDIYVHGQLRATLARVRVVTSLGISAGF